MNGTTREPRLRILIPLVIGCAFFMEGLDSTMIAVAIPDMAESLGEHPLRLNLVITTYLLSLAVFLPISGWMTEGFGPEIYVSRGGLHGKYRIDVQYYSSDDTEVSRETLAHVIVLTRGRFGVKRTDHVIVLSKDEERRNVIDVEME